MNPKILGCSFCLGALYSLAFAPIHWLAMALLAWVGLFFLIEACDSKSAFWVGWFFGWGHFISGLYWISLSFFVDMARTGWFAIPAVLCLAAFLALYAGAAMALWRWLTFNNGRSIVAIILFGFLWSLFEYGRGIILTGFPWNVTAAIWGENLAVLQFLSVGGVFGLGWITISSFIAAAIFLHRPFNKSVVIYGVLPFVVPMALAWGGMQRLSLAELDLNSDSDSDFADKRKLVLVQPNIAQEDKWRMDKARYHMELVRDLSRQGLSIDKSLVILPEAVLPYDLTRDETARRHLTSVLGEQDYMMVGTLSFGDKRNLLLLLNHEGEVMASYSKNHLVPFGEYAPLIDSLPFLQSILPTISSMKSGSPREAIIVPDMPQALPLICYEVIFPLGNERRAGGWMVNITNDGWFGASTGPWQHSVHGRMRAIEEGLPLVRVANTGISFVSDAWGRVTDHLPLGQRGVIKSSLPVSLNKNSD